MNKILLVGAILIGLALYGIWEQAIHHIGITRYPNGSIASEISYDRHMLPHGQVIHYWDDGRIGLIRNYWHGLAENIVYVDMVMPQIWNEACQFHQKNLPTLGIQHEQSNKID